MATIPIEAPDGNFEGFVFWDFCEKNKIKRNIKI